MESLSYDAPRSGSSRTSLIIGLLVLTAVVAAIVIAIVLLGSSAGAAGDCGGG